MYDGPLFDSNRQIDDGYINIYLDKNSKYVIGNVYGSREVARQYSKTVQFSPLFGRKPTLYRIKVTLKNRG